MKRIGLGFASTAALFLLFGTATVANAQQDQHEQEARPAQERQQQDRPAQQEPQRARQPQQQARPGQQQPQRAQQQPQQARSDQQQPQRAQQQQQPQRAQQQQAAYTVPQRSEQQARGWQQQRGWLQQGAWQGNSSWKQDRAQNWRVQHRTWDQRGGYGGYYIPQDRFVLDFGSRHWFRINSQLTIIGGYPRFQYDGFWFMLVDPWPEYWPTNWYADDDVYVGYNNGYYLYNRSYPGDGIAISVVL